MGYSLSGDAGSSAYREPVYSNVSFSALSLDYRLSHLSPEEEEVVIDRFLTPLALREQEIQGAADNLDTDQAAVWKRNRSEVDDRIFLFNWMRRDLCRFLGFPPGGSLAGSYRVIRG